MKITSFATFFTSDEQHDLFRSGQLVKQWANAYPHLFDSDDVRIALNQASMGYHYFEWLAAILIYHTTGMLSLVEKYQFKNHKRKREILLKLTSSKIFEYIISRGSEGHIQCPDLLVYTSDYQEWFFCEVKGPADRIRPEQTEFFRELSKVTGRDIKFVKFKKFKNVAENGKLNKR